MRILLLFLLSFQSLAEGSLDGIPSAQSLKQAKVTKELLKSRFIEHYLNKDLAAPPVPPKVGHKDFLMTNVARLIRGEDLEAVSKNILRDDFSAWNPGTNFSLIGSICRREGDYSFVLQILLKMAYIDFNKGKTLLSTDAREKLWYELLSQSGGTPYTRFKLPKCPIKSRKDTENHILMVNISKYLTNQLRSTEDVQNIEYDNNKNGLKKWLLNHLSVFLRDDFSELNSRGYQGHSLTTISILNDYAWDPEVKTMARMILDYSYAKLAVQSIGNRRYGPFRRQKKVLKEDLLYFYDTAIARTMVQFGNFDHLTYLSDPTKTLTFYDYNSFYAAIAGYSAPDMIVDLAVDKSTPYWQTFENLSVEMYYGSPSFIINAGGRYKNFTDDFGTGENDVLVVGTAILPKEKVMKKSELVRFEDHARNPKKRNFCVYKNFACGYNLVIPDNIPKSCSKKVGDFTFYDLKNCSTEYNFYLAVFNKKVRRSGSTFQDRSFKNYGFFEAVEASGDFEGFIQSVFENNKGERYRQGSRYAWKYKTTLGETIQFSVDSKSSASYPIVAVNGKRVEQNSYKWKLAEGNIINSIKPGLIEISHPKYSEKIILDARNPLSPKRTVVSKE